ncbi:MAG: transglycosylase domain-containing protein [Oscillospiraceae bacterium]|nr:transglycosylase domain-containing protein [Oscillospiraceae bacterium]
MAKRFLRRFLRFTGKVIGIFLLIALPCALVFGAWLAGNGWLLYQEADAEKSIPARVAAVRSRTDYITLEQMPADYPATVVAVEDRRFYEHGGFDLIAIGRALLVNLRTGSFTEGGSTITQQLAKNLCFSQDKVLVRKAAEIFAALELERRYSKDDILELYINTVYYGSGHTGLEAAAQGYFGVPAAFLTPVQRTLLAGLPKAPSRYSPDFDPELTLRRQAAVVNTLLEQGLITGQRAEYLRSAAPGALARWLSPGEG